MISRVAFVLLTLLGVQGAARAATVADDVFGAAPMGEITAPVVLHYRYETSGSEVAEPSSSAVRVEVRRVGADGSKDVFVDLFEGPERRSIGPIAAREQNPLVLVFLQRDVTGMGRRTGGASGYFQGLIRRAFTDEADTSVVEIPSSEGPRPAKRLVIAPFLNDPAIGRYPAWREKSYAFTVADWMPGGIARLSATTPDPQTGTVVLEESITFERAEPLSAAPAGAAGR